MSARLLFVSLVSFWLYRSSEGEEEGDGGDIQFFKAFSTDHELPNRFTNPISSLPDLRWIESDRASMDKIVSRSNNGLEADEDSPSIS